MDESDSSAQETETAADNATNDGKEAASKMGATSPSMTSATQPKKGRGRPKGSSNLTEEQRAEKTATLAAAKTWSHPGQPSTAARARKAAETPGSVATQGRDVKTPKAKVPPSSTTPLAKVSPGSKVALAAQLDETTETSKAREAASYIADQLVQVRAQTGRTPTDIAATKFRQPTKPIPQEQRDLGKEKVASTNIRALMSKMSSNRSHQPSSAPTTTPVHMDPASEDANVRTPHATTAAATTAEATA